MTIKETLAQRMKRSREEAGLTQQQLASLVRLTPAAIGLIETGDTKTLRSENVFPLARVLNKSPDWLATGNGPERPEGGAGGLDRISNALHANERIKVFDYLKYIISTAPDLRTDTPRERYLVQLDKLKEEASHDPQ